MRYMLIAGLVISAPTAVLLGSAALALLVGKLRRRWRQAVNPRLCGPDVMRAETSRPLAAGPEAEGLRSDARPLSTASAGRLQVVELEVPVPVTTALTGISEHPADLVDHVPAPFTQARSRRQRDDLLCSGRVVVYRRHREDESALPEADCLDQDCIIGIRQHDHVTSTNIARQDDIVHGR